MAGPAVVRRGDVARTLAARVAIKRLMAVHAWAGGLVMIYDRQGGAERRGVMARATRICGQRMAKTLTARESTKYFMAVHA